MKRIGYGAMQLAGAGAFGPPLDRGDAVAVLREAVALGVDHLDTSDYYGPHTTNQIIREALHPYPDNLVISTKVGARRGKDGSWTRAFSADDITSAVHDNLRNLGVDVLELVNLRAMFSPHGPADGSIATPLAAILQLQRHGLVRHIGLSNVTPAQIAEGRGMGEIACVQNHYNITHRVDDGLIDELAEAGIAYVPFFPAGRLSQRQSLVVEEVGREVGATARQVVLAWLLRRSPNILLIPGTSSVVHLRENLAVSEVALDTEVMTKLDRLAGDRQEKSA